MATSTLKPKKVFDPTPYNRYDFFLGNRKIRRAHSQPTQWTKPLILEYERCKNDIEYFSREYVKVIHLDRGLVAAVPYPYQSQMWDNFENNRFNICLASRQSGKTVAVMVWLLHTALFKPDQSIAVVAHNLSLARMIMRRIALSMENMPFFLQPGAKSFDKTAIYLDNNTRIFASASDNDSLRGESISVLYVDEFAAIRNDAEFMSATYPVVVSGETTRIIITSTARGIANEFHTLYKGAVDGTNNFTPFRVDWWDVPGRDEKWKKRTVADIGEAKFRVEFGNSFEGTATTLVDANVLLNMVAGKPIWEGDEGIKVFHKPEEDHKYVMTVDTCKGRGKDFSAFSIFDVSIQPFVQVCTFNNSLISPMALPIKLMKYCKAYNDAAAVIESNDQGASVARDLYFDLGYEEVFVENITKADGIGVFIDKRVKATGCSKMKDMIEDSRMVVNDADAITQLKSFERKGKSYEARPGKFDDMVDNLWLFAWFTETPVFKELAAGYDLKAITREDQETLTNQQVPFIGCMGTEMPDVLEEMILRGYFPDHFVNPRDGERMEGV